MMASAKSTRSGHALSVAVFALAMTMSGLSGQGLPGIPDEGDGSNVPGLGNSTPDGCSVTSSDPGHRDSCNSYGHDGGDGRPGSVSGSGEYKDYRDHPAYREYEAERPFEGPRSTSNAGHPKSTGSAGHPKPTGSAGHPRPTGDQPRATGGGARS
jgi:hypothetical protein